MLLERILTSVFGSLAMFAAVGLIVDSALAPTNVSGVERRRRTRAERSRAGELLLGLGLCSLAAAMFGLDRWRYTTVAVLTGALFFAIGASLNWRLLVESVRVRGAARRRSSG